MTRTAFEKIAAGLTDAIAIARGEATPAVVFFPATVESGDAPGHSVFFPDLPGCTSGGDTVQEAARNAEEALRGHLAGMADDGETVPAPSDVDAVPHDPDVREVARLLVRADLPGEASGR